MSVSVRTRFEVFKRDRFACVYCGRTPPTVLLEVDHITPVAAGATDDMDNLVTACWDCNHGKADRLLEEGVAPRSGMDVTEAQERLDQAVAFAQLAQAERELLEKTRWTVIEAWASVFGAERIESDQGMSYQLGYGRFPEDASIRRVLRRLPVAEVLEAVDITATKFRSPTSDAVRYFFGICWRKVTSHEERL